MNIVEEFLENYFGNSYLFESNDITINTVSDAAIPMTLSENSTFNLSSGAQSVADMQNNIDFLEKKIEYFKAIRHAQGIERTNMTLEYTFDNITIYNNIASLTVSVISTFNYVDRATPSCQEKIFEIDLVNINGNWLVADITETFSWFDAMYKNDEDFSPQSEIQTLYSLLLL